MQYIWATLHTKSSKMQCFYVWRLGISTSEYQTTMLTCDVIDRVESNAKFPYFEWITFLLTLLEVPYSFPVLRTELSVIVGQECWSLKFFKFFVHQWLRSMLPVVKIESHYCCISIIRILNDFLQQLLYEEYRDLRLMCTFEIIVCTLVGYLACDCSDEWLLQYIVLTNSCYISICT